VPYAQTHEHYERGQGGQGSDYLRSFQHSLLDRYDPAEGKEHEGDVEYEEDEGVPVVLEVEVDVRVPDGLSAALVGAVPADVQALVGLVTG